LNAYLIAATVLLGGFVPCGFVALRARAIDAVVALELCGILTVLVLLCLGEGFNSSSYFNVPLICAFLVWISGLVFVRFLGRFL
jgi:multisubunit Na+/H+ antiporter MnhF subunit